MVNNVRLILETQPPTPFPEGGARKALGPIYDLSVVKQLVSGDIIFSVTDKADNDLEILEWDADDVALVIKSLLPKDYRDSEWCQTRNNLKIDADAYLVPYDHINECRNERNAHYYVKFGFLRNKLILALISCHLPRMG
jgi:hypothetical protein